jgi:ribosomal protein L3 glutamine methyltransferase
MAIPAASELGSIRDLIRYAVTRFSRAPLFFGHGQPDAFDEACFLVLRRLQLPLDRTDFFLDARLTRDEVQDLLDLIDQRVGQRLPAAYLIGEAWLQGYRFRVDARVIVPRSFIAELLKEEMAPWVTDAAAVNSVLDLCTGSACLAIIAADAFPNAHVDAVDLSAEALQVAAQNVEDYGLQDRIRLHRSDLLESVPTQRYDLIVCNPPYVTDLAMSRLPGEYLHEPATSLAAGPDGMQIVRRVLAAAPAHLSPDGLLVVEVGDGRAEVERQFPDLPFTWASTSGGDDMVFIIGAQDLPT